MTNQTASRDKAHFERLYAASDDPWHFRDSAYEHEKYDATLAALPKRIFTNGLEVGCSIGELTARLAQRCRCLLGIDIVEAPLRAASARCADMNHVDFRQMAVPGEWPAGKFDLIVLSEVLYFLAPNDLRATAARVRASLAADGIVLLVNWLGATGDPGTGDSAAEAFIAAASPELRLALQQLRSRYRIDVLSTNKEALLF
jgi:SAM-dependent methyltransferase